MNWNRIKLFLLFVLLSLLKSCSIPTDFYIQNLTDEIKIIKIKYKDTISNQTLEALNFKYKNGIISPKEFQKTKEANLKDVKKSNINSHIIEAEILPASTTLVAKSMNYRWLMYLIESIEIDNKRVDIKEIESKSEKFKRDHIYKIE